MTADSGIGIAAAVDSSSFLYEIIAGPLITHSIWSYSVSYSRKSGNQLAHQNSSAWFVEKWRFPPSTSHVLALFPKK